MNVKQVTQFYKMRCIFYIDNMRAVGEFSAVGDLILVTHKLTSACNFFPRRILQTICQS